MFDYGRTGMKHVVQITGTPEDVTACIALHPDAGAPTRSMLGITCIAMSACVLYIDIDIWLHNPRNWCNYMRGATVIACHTGMCKYAPSMCTISEDTTTYDTISAPPMWRNQGCIGAETPHGTVTTTIMGAIKGDPSWDDLRTALTRRDLHIDREHVIGHGLDTLYFRNRLTYHYHIGLVVFTNHLH